MDIDFSILEDKFLDKNDASTVAESGDYNDLINKPEFEDFFKIYTVTDICNMTELSQSPEKTVEVLLQYYDTFEEALLDAVTNISNQNRLTNSCLISVSDVGLYQLHYDANDASENEIICVQEYSGGGG